MEMLNVSDEVITLCNVLQIYYAYHRTEGKTFV